MSAASAHSSGTLLWPPRSQRACPSARGTRVGTRRGRRCRQQSTRTAVLCSGGGAGAAAEGQLLRLCAATGRGEAASAAQRESVEQLVQQLESSGAGIAAPASSAALNGRWALAYASEDLTRSSPFFWELRAALAGATQPLPGLPSQLTEALFAITDGIPNASVGLATHTISGAAPFPAVAAEGGAAGGEQLQPSVAELKSEVVVQLRVLDALLPPQVGTLTSTAELQPRGPDTHAVRVRTTAVLGSTWAQLPPLQFVEQLQFPSRQFFDQLLQQQQQQQQQEALLRTTFLSASLRVSRVEAAEAPPLLLLHTREL